ncbi:unnamed protein product, partial [Enterobius vermicularis]|uniref:Rho GTPase-activating protein 39 n=1 Tax=Enterobius vermicularis TaxID=51028 RepID=A0A0N4VQ11_ENTVE
TVYSQRPGYIRQNDYYSSYRPDLPLYPATTSGALVLKSSYRPERPSFLSRETAGWIRKKREANDRNGRISYLLGEMRPTQGFRNRSLSPSENLLKRRSLDSNCIRANSNSVLNTDLSSPNTASAKDYYTSESKQYKGLTAQLSPRFSPSALDMKRLEPFEPPARSTGQQQQPSTSRAYSEVSPKTVVKLASPDSWISTTQMSPISPTVPHNFTSCWRQTKPHSLGSPVSVRNDHLNLGHCNSDSQVSTEVSSDQTITATHHQNCSVTTVGDVKVRAAVCRDVSTKRYCGTDWEKRLFNENQGLQIGNSLENNFLPRKSVDRQASLNSVSGSDKQTENLSKSASFEPAFYISSEPSPYQDWPLSEQTSPEFIHNKPEVSLSQKRTSLSHTCLYSGDQQDVKQNRLSLISYGDLPVVEKSCAHLDVEGRKPQGTDVDAKGDYRRISKTDKEDSQDFLEWDYFGWMKNCLERGREWGSSWVMGDEQL